MPRYAIVESGVVSNVVVWDGESDWAAPDDAVAVILQDGAQIEPGYAYDGANFSAPVSPPPALADAQAAQIAILTDAYNAAIQMPVSFTTAGGVTKIFQADSGSQNVLLIATTGYNMVGATPTGFYWVSSDNTQVPFALADLKGLYGVMLTQGNIAFQQLQTLKAAVRAATTVAAAQAVSWH